MSAWALPPVNALYQVFHSFEYNQDWTDSNRIKNSRIIGSFWTLPEAEEAARSSVSGLTCSCKHIYGFNKDRCNQKRVLEEIKWLDAVVNKVHERVQLVCYEGERPTHCAEQNTFVVASHDTRDGSGDSVWIEKTLMHAKDGSGSGKTFGTTYVEPASTASTGTGSLFTFASATSPSGKTARQTQQVVGTWD